MPRISELPLDIGPSAHALLSDHLADIDVSLTQNNEAIRLTKGGLVMDLDWIGEGYDGDFDEDDPEDDCLLRFSFYVSSDENDELTELDDSSYCTHLSLRLSLVERLYAAGAIFKEVYDVTGPEPDAWGSGVKRACEALSAINLQDIKPFLIAHHHAEMERTLPEASPKPSSGPRF